jgi:hypothetical protein
VGLDTGYRTGKTGSRPGFQTVFSVLSQKFVVQSERCCR